MRFWWCWLLALAPVRGQVAILDSFTEGVDNWRPRAETITLTQDPEGAPDGTPGSLRVAGPITGGWNYAMSPTRPLEPGQLYRFSAKIKLLRLGNISPAPFLKCEFVAAEPGTQVGRVGTNPVETAQMGEWQEVVAEFKAPDIAVGCWFAVEKGTDEPTEVELLLDEVRLEKIERLTALDRYRLDPAPLEPVRGVHPRLYLDPAGVAKLRRDVATTHAELWAEVQAIADRYAANGPPAYRERDNYSGDEQLWQREVGNAMPYLAIAWLITEDRKYADAAEAWAVASCGYPTWGLGRTDGMDLAAGHQLYGLGLIYDWCFDALSDQGRRTIRDTILARAGKQFEAAATGEVWWQRSYLQNHLWISACGLACAGLAVFDKHEEALRWVGLAVDKFGTTMESLGPDGASHEGVGYWEYGAEYLLKYMELARQRLGLDLYDHPWWRNTADYALYLQMPRSGWSDRNYLVDLADCPRTHWYGPDHILRRLAAQYRDPQAQWLADAIDSADIDARSAKWLNLLWYDPSLAPVAPEEKPTLRHFDDLEIVAARTDWSGDEGLLVFKCGPFIGHEALHAFRFDPGGGHVHPDANHFVWFAGGEWLLRDDGYRPKWTQQHNTLLIDGQGQLGEGREWFNGGACLAVKADPKITAAESTPDLDRITGDATDAYPEELGLESYLRHVLWLKPNVVIVIDEVELAEARPLELRFHPEYEVARDGERFVAKGKKTTFAIQSLTPDQVTAEAANLPTPGRHGQDGAPMWTVRYATTAARWRHVTALSWAPAGEAPVAVTMREEAGRLRFEAAGRTVEFDPVSDAVVVP